MGARRLRHGEVRPSARNRKAANAQLGRDVLKIREFAAENAACADGKSAKRVTGSGERTRAGSKIEWPSRYWRKATRALGAAARKNPWT
jgi:hypothetical protein